MVLYFSVRNTAHIVRQKLVPVTCEKCGCEYYYELTRIGAGETEAAYGILDFSNASAEQQAETDAWNQLANDAELVPCPNCRWINENLVRRYRISRAGGWSSLASLVSYLGAGITLIATLIGYFGANLRQGLILYIIGPGIIGTLLVTATIKAIQKWLEHRIQPNRDYPGEPRLPLGTPPALVLNDERQLIPASPNLPDNQLHRNRKSMAFVVGRHSLAGHTCCVCMENANPLSSVTIQPIEGFNFQMGLCWRCGLLKSVASVTKWLGAALVVFAATSCLTFLAGIHEEGILFVNLLLSVAVGLIVRCFVRYPIGVTVVDRSRGVLRLRFKNPQFPSLVHDRQPIEEKETDAPDFSFLDR